jgi:hypothetical protein
MEDLDEWVVFQVFPERSATAALAGQLEVGGCPAKFEARALGNAVETDYCVFVPKYLAHRARWILAQLPVTDEELEFLATGKLPGQKEK